MKEAPAPVPKVTENVGVAPPARYKGVLQKGRLMPHLGRLTSWGSRGTLAITDQALLAGAQFLLNILLARWLVPAKYGAFAVAYSLFLLASGVHNALLIEPMLVFGSGRHFKNRKSYLGVVLRGHWILTLPTGAVLFGVGFLVGRLHSQSVGRPLSALGLALPLMLFAWLTRRAFYIELKPGRAAAGSAVYFSALLVLVFGLHSRGILSPATAVFAMGAAALLSGGVELFWLRCRWPQPAERLTAAAVASEHWGYGRWALASALTLWVPMNVYYMVLPAWLGLRAAGALKALMNLANPVLQSFVAFSLLLIPLLVRHRDRGGITLVRRSVKRIALFFLVASSLYLAGLWFFQSPLIGLLYGGRYLELRGLPILLVGSIPLVASLTRTAGGALRALERPDRVFWCYVASCGVALAAGLPLAWVFGVVGALLGLLLSYIATATTMYYFLWRRDVVRLPDKEESFCAKS